MGAGKRHTRSYNWRLPLGISCNNNGNLAFHTWLLVVVPRLFCIWSRLRHAIVWRSGLGLAFALSYSNQFLWIYDIDSSRIRCGEYNCVDGFIIYYSRCLQSFSCIQIEEIEKNGRTLN